MQNSTRAQQPKYYLVSSCSVDLVSNYNLILQNRKEGETAESSCDEFKDDLVHVMPLCRRSTASHVK